LGNQNDNARSWEENAGKATGFLSLFRRFLQKTPRERAKAIGLHWDRLVSRRVATLAKILNPIRLSFGVLWIESDDHIGKPVAEGTFETLELGFVGQFLKPGMVVLDIGAHHGLYSLLSSKRVGAAGKVFAFEPSLRERKALRRHLLLNRCRNVVLERFALGNKDAESDFYVVEEWAAGCNSLKPPSVSAGTSLTRVEVARLDGWLSKHKISNVEFIKLDVEGAELEVLRGAEGLLSRTPRPVILAEVQDIRTEPWGYRAKEIIEYLLQRRFRWFSITATGSLQKLDITQESFDGNFVAIPEEFEPRSSMGDF
jgi:FkbM family methyltransferase